MWVVVVRPNHQSLKEIYIDEVAANSNIFPLPKAQIFPFTLIIGQVNQYNIYSSGRIPIWGIVPAKMKSK